MVPRTCSNFASVAHALPRGTHAEARGAVVARALRHFEDGVGLHESLGFHIGLVARALGAVAAVLGAAAGLDGKQGAELDLAAFPVVEVGDPRLLDEVEEGLVVDGAEVGEVHDGE